MSIYCSWCTLRIIPVLDDVPRCRKCSKPVCDPSLRDCAFEHYRVKHEGAEPRPQYRRVEETRPL